MVERILFAAGWGLAMYFWLKYQYERIKCQAACNVLERKAREHGTQVAILEILSDPEKVRALRRQSGTPN